MAITHIILKSFCAVMPETIVISDNKLLDIQTISQHFFHEIIGRKLCHRRIEWQNHRIVYARFREQKQFSVKRIQQLWHIIALQNLTRMAVKRNHSRCQSARLSNAIHLLNEVFVPTMYPIKEANRSHTRRHSIIFFP